MDRETLQALLNRQPFESIGVTTHDGATRYVIHPEFVALGTQRLVLIDPATDRMEIVPFASISSVGTWEKLSA